MIRVLPRPAADAEETWASVDRIGAAADWAPATPLEVGVKHFAAWFREFEGTTG